MNKNELLRAVAESTQITNAQAETIVKAVFDHMAAGLVRDHEVAIKGFGTFSVRTTHARTGRNPQTGEPIEIPAGKTIKFKASKNLKTAIGD